MIAVYRSHEGWTLRQEETELGYYGSLPEVMSVIYTKERKTDSYGNAEQGDTAGKDSRSAESRSVSRRGQRSKSRE